MTDSTSAFLSDRLCELEDAALIAVAVIADVEVSIARRARAGELVTASDALRLMAAIGYDPLTRKRTEPRRVGKFDHDTLKLFLRIQMAQRQHSDRAAAAEMDASVSAIHNMRIARPVSIANVLKACAYLNIHPLDPCERVPVKVREAA